jgi:hypothetical protein
MPLSLIATLAPHPAPAVIDPQLHDLAGRLTPRDFRVLVGYYLAANYPDAGGEGTVLCPMVLGGDAVIPIPLPPHLVRL